MLTLDETKPLLPSNAVASSSTSIPGDHEPKTSSQGQRTVVDKVADAFILLGLALFVGTSLWAVLIANDARKLKWFALHPSAQSLGVAALVLAVTTLQPTSTKQPKEKARGFQRHRSLVLALGVPLLTIGSSAMIYNKASHGAKHFTTAHGQLGLLTLAWLVLQSLAGLFVSQRPLYTLLGGQARARQLFKHHRRSGYVVLPLMLLTVHTGGAHSDWALGNLSVGGRVAGYWVGVPFIMLGLLARVRPGKLGFGQ